MKKRYKNSTLLPKDKVMETNVQTIPESLIYEMTDDGPIYYRGYEAYLDGTKTLEEIMGSSILQSSVVTDLVYALISGLSKEYKVLSSELGIQLSKGKHRSADIAIVRRDQMRNVKDKHKYLGFAPEVVIEVDIKANLKKTEEGMLDSVGYINEKTEELFRFGVKKVIWILTDTEKVIVAEASQPWTLVKWGEDILVLDECQVNVKAMVDEL